MIKRNTVSCDFKQIELQYFQSFQQSKIGNYDFTELLKHENYTFEDNGLIIAICSVVKMHEHRYFLSSFISKHAGNYMLSLTREINKYINNKSNCRIETTVSPGFIQGIQWVSLLGFNQECLLRKFNEDGTDVIMFSIINN